MIQSDIVAINICRLLITADKLGVTLGLTPRKMPETMMVRILVVVTPTFKPEEPRVTERRAGRMQTRRLRYRNWREKLETVRLIMNHRAFQ